MHLVCGRYIAFFNQREYGRLKHIFSRWHRSGHDGSVGKAIYQLSWRGELKLLVERKYKFMQVVLWSQIVLYSLSLLSPRIHQERKREGEGEGGREDRISYLSAFYPFYLVIRFVAQAVIELMQPLHRLPKLYDSRHISSRLAFHLKILKLMMALQTTPIPWLCWKGIIYVEWNLTFTCT